MSEIILIDTDILIDAGRAKPEALSCLKLLEQNSCLALSIITQMELLVGCRNKKESKSLERFISRFQILKLSESISDKAVNLLKIYRLSHGILIPDALIAATALDLDCPFVTKNQRDYRFINQLRLLSYPS
ncbi:MAG: type II toxin-antitoxin system VapC family toxin [Syntrophobacter sp.]